MQVSCRYKEFLFLFFQVSNDLIYWLSIHSVKHNMVSSKHCNLNVVCTLKYD